MIGHPGKTKAPFPFTGVIRRIEVNHQPYRRAADGRTEARARFLAEVAQQ